MIQRLRSSPSVIIFWLISISATFLLWGYLPSVGAQISILGLLALIIVATLLRSMELPLIATVLFTILLINDVLVVRHLLPIFGTIAIFFLLPLIGLLSEIIGYEELQIRRSHWAILGLLTAEANSLFYYWPVSFFNRTLLTGIVFYALWQLLRINEHKMLGSTIAHFIFVGLTVILVMGVIIWVNFPQLTGF